ncbi:hypothetical protein C7212DRAFT_145834, partial [Tuber magnatum]
YSGYKKCHSIKFQAIMIPDGIISCLAGPWFGKDRDWKMYIYLGLEKHLREINQGTEPDEHCYLYGNPAYALLHGIVRRYRAIVGLPLNPVIKVMNTHMSSMRVSVEYGFGKTMNLWSFNRFKGSLKSGLLSVTGYFLVAVLFSNIHSCFHRNETCTHLHCNPPLLSSYL